MCDGVRRVIAAALIDIGVVHQEGALGTWRVEVPSVARRSVTVGMALGERTLSVQVFLMRAPDRRRVDVYERLLRKNFDLAATGAWRFAIDEHGDIYLSARVPTDTVDARSVDELLGTLTVVIDETFPGLMETGFVVPPRRTDHPLPGG